MESEILSKEDYIQILQERFKIKDIKFKSAEWHSLSENIEGFMGEHYKLKLNYQLGENSHSENFFVKTKPRKNEYQKEVVSKMSVYTKEVFLYKNLYKEYEKMGYFTQFAPKAYYVKGEDTIVMEDLMEKGYRLTGRTNFYDLDHCKAALRSLAYYHANYLAFEETKSIESGKTYRINQENPEAFEIILFKEGDTESLGAKYIQSSIDCIFGLAKILPRNDNWKDEFEKKLKNFDYVRIMNEALPFRQSCTHGDLWCNNMLFNYSNNQPNNCCLVDFQVLRYHHLAYDVLLLIHSNTRKALRDKHLEELLTYYYSNFENILKGYGHDPSRILPKEHFLKTVEIFHAVSIMQSICGRTMTFLPVEVTNEAVKSGGDEIGNIIEDGRVTLVLEGFRKNELFRDIMVEDLSDLYDHL